MILDNQGLIHHLVRSLCITDHPLYDYDDLIQVGNYALCLAIDKFDKSISNAFTTYASQYILGYVKTYIRKNSSELSVSRLDYYNKDRVLPITVSLNEETGDNTFIGDIIRDPEDDISYAVLVDTVKSICNSMKQSDKYDLYELWSLHHIKGYTTKQIADHYSISKTMVCNRINQINSLIRKSI